MDLQTEHTRLNMEDYRILHQLGLGSYGSAHLALHIPSDTKCVIKEINISHMSPKEIEEARREVKVLSSLSHPYITQFRASCEEDGRLMIAMDYCGGGDLHTIISSRKGVLFPEDRILDWFVQLCLAVKYIHDRKILHRDIKSQNIFLTDDGKIRLGDFGIAKVLNSTSDLARTCIGTPYYLSPEMCENKPYNNKSDIWALGCVLYEMITLKHAFEANNMKALILKIVKGIYQPVSTRYSRDLRLLLGQIFQREPQVRPSISVILRKTFILKKVPRFISGCEEEELMASLMKRKCALPASARNVPVMKRPSDVTDPSVKYGVSQSFSKRVTQRSPTKCTSKVYKQAVSAAKKSSGVPYVRAPKLTQEHRKKFQSENSLLVKDKVKAKPQENNDGRSQRRSKSVPLPLKQSNSKPQNHHVKKKAPSPVKLKLMLDRAGIKKNGLYQNKIEIDKRACNLKNHESNNSPGAEGWLVDEFLSKKLQAAYNDRKLAEALLPPDTSESESATFDSGIPTRFKSVAKVDEKGNKIQNDMCWVSKDLCACKLSKLSRKMGNKDVLHLHNDQSQVDQFLDNISPNEQLQEKNRKDVKELANKTLKQHSVNGSDDDDDDEDLPVLPAEKVRALIHEKIKKLLQERSEKMNQMVLERRQWAYQREKLESTAVKDEEGLEFLGNMIKCNVNYNIGGEQDLELNKGSISSKFPDESKIHLAGSKSIVETVYSTCANVSTTSANESPLNVLMNKTEHRGPDDEICSAGSTKPKHQIRECIMPPDFRERCVEQIPNEMLSNAFEEWVKVGNLSGNLAQNQSKQHNQITLKSNSLIETIDEMTFEKKYQFSQLNVCKCKPESSDVDLYEITSKGSVTSSPNISELSTNVTSIDITEGTTDKHSTGTSYSLPSSHCVTPSKRSHWGSAITSGLENSPLESTGSKMESTSSSDLVVVYKEVGERKQWIKNCKDIINVLSEAKIIESPVFQKTVKKCECEVDAKEALNNEMGISNGKYSVNPNKSAVLNSTFTVTLKECVGDCKDYKSNCISDSFPNAIIISNKTSSVENNHLIKMPSSLNITFEIGNQEACNNHKMPNHTNEELCRPNFVETACSGAQISDTSCVENIDLDKTLILEVRNEECPNTNNYTVENKDNRAGNQLSTTLTGEKIQSTEAIETIPPSADDTVKPLDETFTVEDNMADITYIIPSEPSNNSHKKAKGGLLGMLRLHMSPRPKKKYVIADGVSRSAEDKLKRKMSDSLLGITKVWNTPVTKQKKSKCGLTGMLQKLPCRQDVNLESTEAVEKGTLEITEICEKSTGDSESKENCSVMLDTKKFGIKEYSKTNKANSSMKNYKPDLASSEPTNRVRENNEMSRKGDKDNLLLHETTGSEGFAEVLKRERLVLKELPGIDQGNDTDDKLRTKDDQSFEGTQISVIIQDNDSLVPVIEEKVEPGFDFAQTNVQGTELCTSIANSNNNSLNNAEIHLSIINSKTDAPSICLNNVSSDSGLGTQTTDFTCITADDEASDVESVLNYSLEKCDQASLCQTQSSEINNLADYASSGVDEEIYSVVMMKKAPKMQFFEKGISLPALKANKISMTTDDYSNEMEDSIHCAKDIAHTVLLDVFERAREQVSVNDTRERYRDISPITPRSIHINMNCSGEIKDQNLKNQHENEDLLYHSKLCTSSLGTLQSKECKNEEVDMQKIDDTLPNWKMKNNRRIDYEGSIVTSSPAIPRPTQLCIGSNNNADLIADLMYLSSLQTLECEETEESYVERFFKSQEDESKLTLKENYMLSEGSTSVPVPQNNMQHQCSQSNIHVQSKDLPEVSDAHLGARAKTCILTDNCNKDNNNSTSDEESEDFANLRQSMELLLGSREQRRESDCKSIISLWTGASSELWHLDDDGGVVSGGGGGVYGWIEEQRAKLEDILGLELFMRAYHHLEEAQEREGCVVGEAVTRVEEMLGRENCHMAYDILQLVVSEAVYHN